MAIYYDDLPDFDPINPVSPNRIETDPSGQFDGIIRTFGRMPEPVQPVVQPTAPIIEKSIASTDYPRVPVKNSSAVQANNKTRDKKTKDKISDKKGLFARIGDKMNDPAYMARLAMAFNSMRLNPDPNIAQYATEMQKQVRNRQAANQTVEFLKSKNRPDLAQLVEDQPDLAREVLQAFLSSEGKRETFGTSVHHYTDAEGNPRAYQVSALGGRRDLELPEGATPVTSELEAAGKKFTALELQYLTEKEQDGKEGIDVMSRQLMALNDALADPDIMSAISSKVGVLQGRIPAVTSEQTLGESYIENFAAKSFMRAFQMLKGGGQITEREGAAAAAAIDRLQKFTLSDEDYKKAMEDARDELQDLVDIAESRQLALGKRLAPYRERMNQMLGM